MEAKTCPFCGSLEIRLREGLLRVRIMPQANGGPGVERSYLVYRCRACGRGFVNVKDFSYPHGKDISQARGKDFSYSSSG